MPGCTNKAQHPTTIYPYPVAPIQAPRPINLIIITDRCIRSETQDALPTSVILPSDTVRHGSKTGWYTGGSEPRHGEAMAQETRTRFRSTLVYRWTCMGTFRHVSKIRLRGESKPVMSKPWHRNRGPFISDFHSAS